MAHFSSALWLDLSKGVLTGDVAAQMRRHLADRCMKCEESYRRFTEQAIHPPVALVFDTLQQALPAGVRSATVGSRHLLYRVDDLTADLRLEASARTGRLLLIGQLADPRRPGAVPGPLRVAVFDAADEVVSLEANELGEFQCEFDRRDGLALWFMLPLRPPIIVPLDHLPAVPASAWDAYRLTQG